MVLHNVEDAENLRDGSDNVNIPDKGTGSFQSCGRDQELPQSQRA